eukprot:gene31199-41572_t
MKFIFLISISLAALCFHNALLLSSKYTKPLSKLLCTQYRKPSYVSSGRLLHIKNRIATTDDQSSTWVIDEDTSEIECESSAELARKIAAEKARIEAEIALKKKQEEEERLRLLALEEEEEKKKKKALEVALVVQAADSSSAVVQSSNSEKAPAPAPAKKTAFDVGLIILFPVMIGTLLLFLFFPVIGQQLAGSLPPPS